MFLHNSHFAQAIACVKILFIQFDVYVLTEQLVSVLLSESTFYRSDIASQYFFDILKIFL